MLFRGHAGGRCVLSCGYAVLCLFVGYFSVDQPGVWPGILCSCRFGCRVLVGGCCRVLIGRVNLVVFMVGGGWGGGGGFVRSGFILKPGCSAVEAPSQAAALGVCGCGRSYHCRIKYTESDKGRMYYFIRMWLMMISMMKIPIFVSSLTKHCYNWQDLGQF